MIGDDEIKEEGRVLVTFMVGSEECQRYGWRGGGRYCSRVLDFVMTV